MENEKPNLLFFRFEDLRIYHKALDYVAWIHHNLEHTPDPFSNPTLRQLISASQSIAINIAEGSGRNKVQFIYYLKLAKSSIRECLVMSTIASKLNFFSENVSEESKNYLIEMTKMIGALIASLQKAERNMDRHDEETDDIPMNLDI